MFQSSSLKYSVLALALFGAVLLMCRKDPLHGQVAPEREWSPPLAGAVEQTMRQLLPPAQTPKSPPSIQPDPLIQVDLLLPPEPSSLNLNNKADDENTVPLPSLLPPPPPPMLVEPILQPAREVPEPSTTLPQSGDVTMKGIQFAMSAILGATLVAAPAIAQEPKDDVSKTVERLEASIRKLESIEKNLTEYKTSNSAAVSQVQNDLEAVKSRLRQLDEDIKALRQIANNAASTSKRDTPDVAPKMGRVKLSNDYVEEMSVVVNGTAYRLLPGQSRTISVPPGIFTYQVLQLQRNVQERPIAADEEKPIRIFTQQ